MNYRLVSEVIRYWRADPEERALAEAVLELLGLNRQDLEKKTVQEIENELRYSVNAKGRSEAKEGKAVAHPRLDDKLKATDLDTNIYNPHNQTNEPAKQQNVLHTEISTEDQLEQEQLNTASVHPVTEKIKRGRKPNV